MDRYDPKTVSLDVLRQMINLLIKEGHVGLTPISNAAKKNIDGFRQLFSVEKEGIPNDDILESYRKAKNETDKNTNKKQVKELYEKKNAYRTRSSVEQQQAFHAKVRKIAHGKSDSVNGLYDDQIDQVMDKFKDYRGSIMCDQIKSLLPDIKPQSRVAFIINTDPHDKPGAHWNSIYIDARNGPESSNS